MKHNKPGGELLPKETSRIEAFSDGVFSIAITLLILELIQVLHEEPTEGLLKNLAQQVNSFLAFLIGFLTILICWINHHLVVSYIKRVNSSLMWANGFVLLVVTFTPFPTAILAGYFGKEAHTAIAIFGFNYFMMALAAYNITAYAYNKHLIKEDSRQIFYGYKLLYKYSIIYTFLIFLVCFISVFAAIFLSCILFIVFAYPKEFSMKLLKLKKKKAPNASKQVGSQSS